MQIVSEEKLLVTLDMNSFHFMSNSRDCRFQMQVDVCKDCLKNLGDKNKTRDIQFK